MRSDTVLADRLDELFQLQKSTPNQPYSIRHRLRLAKAYWSLGYPDLAAGDAYKALLLVDEIVDEGEYHDEALEAAITDISTHTDPLETRHDDSCCCQVGAEEVSTSDEDRAVEWAKSCWSKSA